MAMITETSVAILRRKLGEMLHQVQLHRGTIAIKKDGKTVAALVDVRLFERIRRVRARLDSLARKG